MLLDSTLKGSDNAIISNIHGCLRRFPPFIIGMGIAGWVKSGKVIELWKLVVGFILFAVGYKFAKMYLIKDLECAWLLLIPLVIVLIASVSLVKKCRISQTINRSCKMMGKISLESYLTNVFFCTILVEYVFVDVPARYNPGNYVMYSLVIVLGISMAIGVNRLSDGLIMGNRNTCG